MKLNQGVSMETGETRYSKYVKNVIGSNLPDSFFDSCSEERAICSDILDRIGLIGEKQKNLTLTFNIQFLKKLVRSHIMVIKTMRER